MESEAAALSQRIRERAAQVHAMTADLALLAAEFDDAGGWTGVGMRGCAHWLSVETGVDSWTASELIRVGHALAVLPLLRAAFTSGQLSFDKVRQVTRVATATDERIWVDLAIQASGAQLSRICRAFRLTLVADDPERAARQRARRRLATWWRDEDGMLELYATLPPEEGQLVLRAIEAAVEPPRATSDIPGHQDDAISVEHPYGARRTDALVRICERWLDGAAPGAPHGGTASNALVVHVDLDTLTGATTEGRCHLDDGPAVAVSTARRIGCDAAVVAVIEKGGVPLNVGRTQRIVPRRLARLLRERDGGCTYPGCPVPAADTEGHHIRHWADLGRTDLDNLLSLCRFHHHRHHDGDFSVVRADDPTSGRRAVRFETRSGRVIGARVWSATPLTRAKPASAHASPVAGDGGRTSLGDAVQVTAGATHRARRRAQRAGESTDP